MTASTLPARDAGVIDRMSGRSTDEFEPETDLTVSERAARFLESAEEYARAARIAAAPEAPGREVGTREEVIRAKRVLEASIRHHAATLSDPELDLAVKRGELSAELAAAVKAFRAERARPKSRTRVRKRE